MLNSNVTVYMKPKIVCNTVNVDVTKDRILLQNTARARYLLLLYFNFCTGLPDPTIFIIFGSSSGSVLTPRSRGGSVAVYAPAKSTVRSTEPTIFAFLAPASTKTPEPKLSAPATLL